MIWGLGIGIAAFLVAAAIVFFLLRRSLLAWWYCRQLRSRSPAKKVNGFHGLLSLGWKYEHRIDASLNCSPAEITFILQYWNMLDQLVLITPDCWGYPLHLATINGYEKAVEFFLANGAEINAKNEKGETPLDNAKNDRFKDLLGNLGGKPGKSIIAGYDA
ncbi:MAG: ankyrin repeat domain-containing protein [Planctomycetota bacterium]